MEPNLGAAVTLQMLMDQEHITKQQIETMAETEEGRENLRNMITRLKGEGHTVTLYQSKVPCNYCDRRIFNMFPKGTQVVIIFQDSTHPSGYGTMTYICHGLKLPKQIQKVK